MRLWLSSNERNGLLYIPLIGALAHILLTIMVCDEDTAVNGPVVEGLSGCASKETRVRFLEEMRIESSIVQGSILLIFRLFICNI